MRLEQVRLAIRPRSELECLDISFLFCRHHLRGLSLAAAAGVLPLSLLNHWLLTLTEVNPYLAYLLLSMEIPWAMIFVTTYLGQVTFTRQPSIRRLLLDVISAVPSMILYQGIVRGICLVVVFGAPMAFIGMYYLNEIVLLEKTPIMKTWDRRTAINSRSLGHMISLRMLDLMVLCLVTPAFSSCLHTISSVWEGRSTWLPTMPEEISWLYGRFLHSVSWQTELAFWSVIVFLTVFRFVTYLDCRIRREGWDVELKLRTQSAIYDRKELVS